MPIKLIFVVLLNILFAKTSLCDPQNFADPQTRLKVLQNLDQNGYPFAQIKLDSQVCSLETGPLFGFGGFLDSLQFSPSLKKGSGLKPGETWNIIQQKKAIERLRNTNYYSQILSNEIYKDSNLQLLYQNLILQKKLLNSFFFLGAADPQTASWEGQGQGEFKNIFDQMRDFDISLFRSKSRQFWQIHYKEYGLLSTPLTLNLWAQADFKDSVWNTKEASASLSWMSLFQSEIEIKSRFKWILTGLQTQQVYSEIQSQGLIWKKRINKTEDDFGFQLSQEVLQSTQFNQSIVIWKTNSKIEKSILWNKIASYYSVQELNLWTENKGPELLTEMMEFGGAKTLRGYRERSMQSPHVFLQSAELIWLLDPQFQALIFWDKANYGSNIQQINQKAHGFGLGLLFENDQTQLNLSLGVPQINSTSDALIHILFKQYF